MAAPSWLDILLGRAMRSLGSPITRRTALNFGSGFTVTDDPTNDQTTVTTSGGGSGGTGNLIVTTQTALKNLLRVNLTAGQSVTVEATNKTWTWSATTGAGFAGDDRTVAQLAEGVTADAGRFYINDGAPIVPTFAALKLAVSGVHDAIDVQAFASLGDGGGGTWNKKAGTVTENIGATCQPIGASFHYERRYSGPMFGAWFGVVTSSAEVHDANGTDTAKAATNTAAVLAMGNAIDALGGGEGRLPPGFVAMKNGTGCLHAVGWTNVHIRGDSLETTRVFDPQVAATVGDAAARGAFFWLEDQDGCTVSEMTLAGSGVANYSFAVANGVTRTERKGIYWQAPSTNCLTERVRFEGIEGECWFPDGGVGAVATNNIARNCQWFYCYSNIWNLGSGDVYAVGCGVEDCSGEGTGQSTFQMGGTRWFIRRVYSKSGADKLSADQILVYNSPNGFEIEDVTIEGFDVSLSTASIARFGQSAGNIRGNVKNLKLIDCKISTDAGSVNAFIDIRALSDLGDVNIDGLTIDGVEFTRPGGIVGPGGKLVGIRWSGPNSIDCTVTNVMARNAAGGLMDHMAQTMSDVPVANRISVSRFTGVDIPQLTSFAVAPLLDHVTPIKASVGTDTERITQLESILLTWGVVKDPAFLPTDLTSVGLDGWYRGDHVILGDTPKASGTSPPVVTLSGALAQPLGIQIDVTTGATLASGNMRFRWSVDNGSTWTASNVVGAATVVLGITGITANFAAGTYDATNLYKATVAKWLDLGPRGLYLAPFSLVKAHEFEMIASTANSKPGLRSDGIDDAMGIGYTRAKPSYIMAVVRADDATASGTIADGLSANQTRFYRTGAAQVSAYAGSAINGAGADIQNYHIYEILWDGASSYILEDGVSLVAGATGSNNAAAGLSIGAFNNASDYFNGTYVELICCNGEPFGAERDAMFATLQARYGL